MKKSNGFSSATWALLWGLLVAAGYLIGLERAAVAAP